MGPLAPKKVRGEERQEREQGRAQPVRRAPLSRKAQAIAGRRQYSSTLFFKKEEQRAFLERCQDGRAMALTATALSRRIQDRAAAVNRPG